MQIKKYGRMSFEKKILSFILDESEVVREHAIENTDLVLGNAWQGLGRGPEDRFRLGSQTQRDQS